MPINVNQISGPSLPSTAADNGGGGIAWTNPNNIKLEDGSRASSGLIGPGGGGGLPNSLKASNFGFNLPSNAVIDGIKLRAKVQSFASAVTDFDIHLESTGGVTTAPTSNTPNFGQAWTGSLAWLTWGGSTSLWGRTWTVAQINSSSFAALVTGYPGTGTGTIEVDAIELTVYWHYAVDVAAADVPTRVLHKVYRDNVYLGNLPIPKSDFGFPQDINSSGASITLDVPLSADTSISESGYLITEGGDRITTEAGDPIRVDGQAAQLAVGATVDPALIQNGNKVYSYLYNYYYPNGKLMFSGQINRIEAGFGGDSEDAIKILVISDGIDLDNMIARGSPFTYTADVSQTSSNAAVLVNTDSGKGGFYNRYGQSWVCGAGVTKLGSISLLLDGIADVTVTIYDGISGTAIGSITQHVDTAGAPAVVRLALASLITTVPGGTYFFGVSVDAGQSIWMYYASTNPYANGDMYYASFGGGSGGGGYNAVSGSDLYFIASSGLATTTTTYSSKDPSTQMLKPIIDDYVLRGGLINYSSSSVDATGLTLSVTFNTDTILDAIKRIQSVSPSNFYWYVDLGTNTIYFKQTSTTADFTIVKGRDIQSINLVMSIENVKNKMLFSGAEAAGTNLYTEYNEQASQTAYGIRLERKSDNRVSLQATADAIGDSFLDTYKNETFETTVTVTGKQMDLTLLKVGKTVGLRGFGTFVDNLLLQIVRIDYSIESAVLTLGTLPKRQSLEIESLTRGLIAEQTVANPTAPS